MLRGEVVTRLAAALMMPLLLITLFLLIDLATVIYATVMHEKGELPVLLAIERSNGCVSARIEFIPALSTSFLATLLIGRRFWRKFYLSFVKWRDSIVAALVTFALFIALTIVLMLIKGSVFCWYTCPITCKGVGVHSCNLLWQVCVCKP